MPELNEKQLASLVEKGATNREIEAVLGRAMSDAQRTLVDKSRVVVKLRKRGRPATTSERVAAHTARHSLVERKTCADPRRRKRMERSPAAWLRWYLAATYTRPFDKPHKDIIAGAMRSHATGGRFLVAAERGVGKSALFYGMVLFFALTRRRRFPVYLPWSSPVMKRGLQFWRSALAFNERLNADYPEFCAPFAHAKGVAQRLTALRWADSEEPCGALLQISDGMIIMPGSLGVIGGSTVNGNPRGLNFPQSDGSVIRPDLALIDDPQDRKVAKSLAMVSETCAKIDGDIAGLGTAGGDFPMLLSGNCIIDGDVMARLIADENWRALRVSCVTAWPAGWKDKGACWRLWREWWSIYQGSAADGVKFYRANRKTMTSGMALSAPHAYRAQVSSTLPDAFCVAMRQYWQMGHAAFMAERQQTPLTQEDLSPFALTVPLILSRTDDSRGPHERPAWINTVIASTDINDYGLSSVALGFDNLETCANMWYGIFDNKGGPVMLPNTNEAEKSQALFDALCRAGEALGSCASKPAVWGIDAGYMGPVVRRYADTAGRKCGMTIILCRGMDGRRYRPGFKAIGAPREQCHMTEWPQIGRGLSWDADYWKEVMQRAWLGDIGKPGSISLFRGEHRELAEQVWRERLLGKEVVAGSTVRIFASGPGRHDYGDAMAQGYAVAAYGGIGTTGGEVKQKQKAVYFSSRPSEKR
jgi:hypothetical protein